MKNNAVGLDGLKEDYSKAREWWEKAAAQGNAGAQSNLGVMYEYGQGVAQNNAKAREWFEKATTQTKNTKNAQ